jgi:hypothetical protein
VLAIAALVIALFIPGLNVVVAGFALASILEAASVIGTVALLAGHTALASTGDGSWLDVGLDVVALATFGAGKAVTKVAEGAAVTARGVAAETAATRATEATLESTRVQRAVWRFADRIPHLGNWLRASDHLAGYETAARAAGATAHSDVLALAPETTALQRALFASEELPARLAQLQAIDAAVPGVPQVGAAITRVTRAGAGYAVLTDGAIAVDGGSHVTEDIVDWKSRIEPYFTYPLIHLP